MKTTPVTDHLTQLTKLHFVNAFLVREDDGFTLVDTTMGRSPKGLIDAARAAGAPIRRIALTHGHGDHVGLLDALRDSLGKDVEVLMPELDEQILAGETEGKFPGSWPKVRTRADRRLQPGDRVGSLEVVATPGHTPGHVAYLDTRDRAVIAGDTFTSYGRVMTSDRLRLPFPLAAARELERRAGPGLGADGARARAVGDGRRPRPGRARPDREDRQGARAGQGRP